MSTDRESQSSVPPASNDSIFHAGNSYHDVTVSGGQVVQGNIYIENYQSINGRNLDRQVLSGSPASIPSTIRGHGPKYIVPRCSTFYFTGRRAQFAKLEECLSAEVGEDLSRKIVVVIGTGGSGKTQFCLKYAETHRNDYWGVFWIDASSQAAADTGYAELGAIFGKGSSPAAGRYWLSQNKKKWLLVLDDVDSEEEDLMSLLPTGDYGHILITTRRKRLETFGRAGKLYLTGMDPDEAIDLLLWSAYPEDDATRMKTRRSGIAYKIAERLGFLASALQHAGSAIRRKIYTMENYLSSYLRCRERVRSISRSETIDREQIITTWEIPFGRIESQTKDSYRDAVALINIFAFLHNQGLYEWMLHAPWYLRDSELASSEELPGILQQSAHDRDALEIRVRLALYVLHDYSLIEFVPSTGSCALHPVIRDWMVSRIEKLSPKKKIYWLRCASYLLAACGSENMIRPEGASVNTIIPHVDTFLQSVKDSAPPFMTTPAEARQLENIASLYAGAGRWSSALEHLTPLIEHRIKAQGWCHEDTLRVKRSASFCHWNLFNVSTTARLQNEILKARWVSRPTWLDWVDPLTPTHTSYLLALSDLTQTCWLGGRRDLSQLTGERALSGLKAHFGEDHKYTLDAMFYLGRTYRHVGLLDEAHRMLRSVYHARRETLGPRHLDTLMAQNEVGMSWCGLKNRANLPLAEYMIRQVLKERTEILGEEHAYTLWSVNDLSKILFLRNRPEESIRYLEGILPAVERTLGTNHIGMRMTKGNLARAYAKSRRYADADECLSQIIAGTDEDEPDWIQSRIGHARIQIRLNKFPEAEQSCRQALTRLATIIADASFLSRLRRMTWLDLLLRLRGLQQDDTAKIKRDIQMIAGLLAEVFTRRGDCQNLEHLRRVYPDLDDRAMEKEFEIT